MMERRLQLTLVLALNVLILFAPTSGLFEATLTSVKLVFPNDTSFMNSNGLKVQRVNRTHVMTGSLEFFVDVSNDYQVVTYFSKKSGNRYNRMPYKLGPAPFCQYYDEDPYFIDGLRKKSNLPPEGTCPWPKNDYVFKNYEVNLDNVPPVITSGDYLVETQYSKDEKILNAIQFYTKIEHV